MMNDIILKAHNITKKFGGLVAVDNLDIEIARDKITFLIGPNGSGKTTFVNIISGFIRPNSGIVWFNGKNITGLSPEKIVKYGLNRTFQEVRPLINLTPLENVLIARLLHIKDIRKARDDAFKILEFLNLDGKAEAAVSTLTEMEIKLLGLARAIATDPVMLIIDEIAAGLTPSEIDRVVKIIRSINDEKGVTMLIIEHVMKAVMSLADYVIVLDSGRKIAEGKPNEIMKNAKVIEAYLGG